MKTNIKKLLLVFSLALLVTGSCKKEPMGPDIYLAGFFFKEINKVTYKHAAYWKNGKLTALDESAFESEAFDIAVEADKVYVAGRFDLRPCIWLDGQKKELTIAPQRGVANYLQIKEGIAYISGKIYLDQQDGTDRACLWIINPDGQIKQQLLENEESSASDLTFDGETLFISGSFKGSPCYWKLAPAGKIRVDLGPKNGYNNGIILYNSEVYIAGAYDLENDGSSPYAGGYWKGSTFYPLGHQADPNTRFDALAFDSAGQLCIAGRITNPQSPPFAYMYKNGQLVKVADQVSAVMGISMFNSDMYLAGLVAPDKDTYACYWKNGTLHTINTPRSVAHDIELVD